MLTGIASGSSGTFGGSPGGGLGSRSVLTGLVGLLVGDTVKLLGRPKAGDGGWARVLV